MPITRRDLLERVSGALASPLLLSRSDAQVTPEILKFSGEIEPLVSLIERTPREKCAEMAVEQMRGGGVLPPISGCAVSRWHSQHQSAAARLCATLRVRCAFGPPD